VGAHVIEFLAKGVEPALLRAEAAGRGARGGRLEGAMHAFVPPVLVGAAGFDELGQDPQAHPPGRELREPGQGRGREGHAVVGANAQRQAILFEQPGEDGLGLRACRGAQPLTAEPIPAEPSVTVRG